MLVAKILRSTRNVRKSTMGLKLGADVRTQNEGCQNPRTGSDVLKNTYVSFPTAIYYAVCDRVRRWVVHPLCDCDCDSYSLHRKESQLDSHKGPFPSSVGINAVITLQ